MRVTFNSAFNQSAADITRAAADLAARQREVSSGRRLHAPSDDPSAAAGSVRERSELAALDRYVGAAGSANTQLTVIDTLLSDVLDRLTAGSTAILSAQGSSVTDLQREAAAGELEGIRDALASDFNSKFRGTFLFGGTAVNAAPVRPPGRRNVFGLPGRRGDPAAGHRSRDVGRAVAQRRLGGQGHRSR